MREINLFNKQFLRLMMKVMEKLKKFKRNKIVQRILYPLKIREFHLFCKSKEKVIT